MPVTHSTAGLADTFAYKQALELATGVNVARKAGFKTWTTRLRLHRALVAAKESELTRELRLMRQPQRREAGPHPTPIVSLMPGIHLPALVATEDARKASEQLRKDLHLTPVELPPVKRRPVGTAEIPWLNIEPRAGSISKSIFDSLAPASPSLRLSQGSSEAAVVWTPRLVKCTPRRRCSRSRMAPVTRTTMMMLQSGDIRSSIGAESSLLTYASVTDDGWDAASLLMPDASSVRVPPSPRTTRMSPRRLKQKRRTLEQTVPMADVTPVDCQVLCNAVLERVYRQAWENSSYRVSQDRAADTIQENHSSGINTHSLPSVDRTRERVIEETAATTIQKHYRLLKMSRAREVIQEETAAMTIEKHNRSSKMSKAHEVC